METKGEIIVILGPTASGKSELAVKLAKRFRGEVVSADSRQVYKGLDIGSGKITPKQMRGIPHYLLDVASPKRKFTVAQYKKLALGTIKKIQARGKIPILCGGTGFYISALLGDIEIPKVKPNWKLRKQLEKKPSEELFNMLKKLDPIRAKTIDPKNPRRLIRAIEVTKAKATEFFNSRRGRAPERSEGRVKELKNPVAEVAFIKIGIKLPDKELKKRIEKRVKKMIGKGLLNEVKNLKKSGLSWKRIYDFGFEYKYPAMYLQKKIGKEEMLKRMILENWHYAKRQMTWFKREKRIKWIKKPKEAEKLIHKFLT